MKVVNKAYDHVKTQLTIVSSSTLVQSKDSASREVAGKEEAGNAKLDYPNGGLGMGRAQVNTRRCYLYHFLIIFLFSYSSLPFTSTARLLAEMPALLPDKRLTDTGAEKD